MNSDLTYNCLASTYQAKKELFPAIAENSTKTIKITVIMPQKTTQQKFQFMTEKYIKANHFQLTRWQATALRKKLPKGIYWVQLAHGGQYHWNWTLLEDYLMNGDRPEHQALVEKYLASRLQTA